MTIPGWYDDPSEPNTERYWNGNHWTTDVRRPDAASRRRPWRRILLAGVAAAAVIGGGVAAAMVVLDRGGTDTFARRGAVVTAGRGDGTAPVDAVLAAMRAQGFSCAEPRATRPSADEVRSLVDNAPAGVADDVDGVADARDELRAVVDDLDATALDLRACGRSLLVTVGDRVHLALLVGVVPSAGAALNDEGVRIVSLRPPSITDVVERLEAAGDTCMATTRKVQRSVVIAEAAGRVTAGGAPLGPAEAAALDHLPDTTLSVRNCSDAVVYGVGGWAVAVVLGDGSGAAADDLDADGPVEVVAG